MMEVLNATEAKREFGDVLIKAQRSPIGINRNGKSVAVILSTQEYEQLQTFKELQLKASIKEGVDDYHAGRVVDGEQAIKDLRKRIT